MQLTMDSILCQDSEIGYISDDGVHSLASLIKTPTHSPQKSFNSPNTEMGPAVVQKLSPSSSRQFPVSNDFDYRLDDDTEMPGFYSKRLSDSQSISHNNGAAGGGICGAIIPAQTYKANLLLSMQTEHDPVTTSPCKSHMDEFDFMLNGFGSLDNIEDELDMEYYHKHNTVHTTWIWCLELKRISQSQWVEFLRTNNIEFEVSKMNIEREESMKRIEIATGCLVVFDFTWRKLSNSIRKTVVAFTMQARSLKKMRTVFLRFLANLASTQKVLYFRICLV